MLFANRINMEMKPLESTRRRPLGRRNEKNAAPAAVIGASAMSRISKAPAIIFHAKPTPIWSTALKPREIDGSQSCKH